MLSGKVPFPGNSELEIIGNVIKGDFHFNHEPFQRHSPEAKEFLQCLIRKDVDSRYTAEEALCHPWIQNHAALDSEPMAAETLAQMEETVEMLRGRKAILLYLSQTVKPGNYSKLTEIMEQATGGQSNCMDVDTFKECLKAANMSAGGRELDLVIQEIDPSKSGQIDYKLFLDSVYLTQMYIDEMTLYERLKKADTEGQAGVTISEVNAILEDMTFPKEALAAAFKAMLGADIDSIEPDCLIDTEKFIASLHNYFADIAQRSLSQIK